MMTSIISRERKRDYRLVNITSIVTNSTIQRLHFHSFSTFIPLPPTFAPLFATSSPLPLTSIPLPPSSFTFLRRHHWCRALGEKEVRLRHQRRVHG
jgi:hypothetical protein